MIVPLLIFIAVALTSYAGFLKLAARLLRYSVPWKVSFLFAGIIMVAVFFHHVVLFSAPVALRFTSWVVRRDSANGAGLCNDDCGGVRDRYADSIFPGQTPFAVAMTFFC